MTQTNTTRAWLIMAVATFGLIVSNGLSIGGIPVFYKGIQDDLIARGAVDPSHAQTFISNCANITFFMSGVFSMLGGWLLTRISLKLLMILGSIALGLGLVLHAEATTVETIYFSRFLMGASLGFVGVTPSVVLVSNWFDKNRGSALGVLLAGTSLGGVTIPFLATPLINAYGWRTAMLLVSLLVWLLLLPAIVFFVKDRDAQAEEAVAEDGFTLNEAIRTPIFWVFGLCAALVFYPIFVTSQQFVLYLQSPKIGASLTMAGWAQSAFFAASVGGKFLSGYFSDRFSSTRVLFLFCLLMFAATLVLFDLSAWTALLFLLPFGLGYGGTFVLLQRLASDYFGRREYGKILGTIVMIEIIGAAIGGRVTGILADRAGGDYTVAFYGVVFAALGAFLCAVLLNVMRKTRVAI
ncbi:MAG TPA: MFS transporter [Pyrinomonadaceae bacterium]|nr:MFS transporter [Pyrinomonadaceae bacterium]